MEERQPYDQPPQSQQQPSQQFQQQPSQQQQPPQQLQRPRRGRGKSTIATMAPYFIMIGAVLIGVGVIILGFAPGNITIYEPDMRNDTVDVEMSITPITVGAILAGIGAIFSGVGGGLNVKAYWDKQEQEKPPSRRF